MKTNRSAMRGKDIRQGNEKLVLRLIQEEGLLSQSEAVEVTGLKAPTILRIFSNLEEAGFIIISDRQKETAEKKGRKPVYYSLNPEALFVAGVEFWASSATVVISNFTREPVFSASVDISSDADGESVLSEIHKLIRKSLKKMKIEEDMLAGIGVGAPGTVDINKGEVIYYSRIKGLKDLPVAEYLEDKFDVPIILHNNCSVIAMNEYHAEIKDRAENILAVLIRGGVGGAYVNGGKIMTSGGVTTMEVGHMSVDPGGRECSCGFRGCLETYLSEGAILNDAAGGGRVPDIFELDKRISGLEPGSELAAVLGQKAEILAYALKNLMHLFSPDLFLIISRSSRLSSYLAEETSKLLKSTADRSAGRGMVIKPVCYDSLHAGMGACDLVFRDFFLGGL